MVPPLLFGIPAGSSSPNCPEVILKNHRRYAVSPSSGNQSELLYYILCTLVMLVENHVSKYVWASKKVMISCFVAKCVQDIAKKRSDANFELVDIKNFNLPLLDEPIPPSMGRYSKEHTQTWSSKIDSFDAYIFWQQNIIIESPEHWKMQLIFSLRSGIIRLQDLWAWQCRWGACSGTIMFSYGRVEGCNRTLPSLTIAFYWFWKLHKV